MQQVLETDATHKSIQSWHTHSHTDSVGDCSTSWSQQMPFHLTYYTRLTGLFIELCTFVKWRNLQLEKWAHWFVPGRTAAVRFKQVWPFKFSQTIAGTQNRRIHLRFFWSTARRQQQRVGGQTCRCRLLKLKADTCSSHQKCTHPSMFSSSTDMWFCSICTACLYCLLKQAVF